MVISLGSLAQRPEAETEPGGRAVNVQRGALQISPVRLVVVPLVQSNQGMARDPQKYEA